MSNHASNHAPFAGVIDPSQLARNHGNHAAPNPSVKQQSRSNHANHAAVVCGAMRMWGGFYNPPHVIARTGPTPNQQRNEARA